MAKKRAVKRKSAIEFVTSDRDGAIAALCRMLPGSTKLLDLQAVLAQHGYRIQVSMEPREFKRRTAAKERD